MRIRLHGKNGRWRAMRFAHVVSKFPDGRPRQFSPTRARLEAARFPVRAPDSRGNEEFRWAMACSREARTARPPRCRYSSIAIHLLGSAKWVDSRIPPCEATHI